MYQSKGDYHTALSYLDKALQMQHECLPSNHLSLNVTHYNLAEAFENLHRYEEAVQHAQLAFDITSQVFESDHHEVIENEELLHRLQQKLAETLN
jgi:tetratricopeptide (TPR) repeat protein